VALYRIATSVVALSEGAPKRADDAATTVLTMIRADPRLAGQRRGALDAAARAAMAVSDWPRALAYAQEAVVAARSDAIDADSSSSVGVNLLLEAQVETGRGQAERATALATEALPHLQENLGADNPKTREARELATK
jgi:hypothetical protein